jgi:hypothetical protein
MTSPTVFTTRPRGPISSMTRLRRVLARPHRHRTTTPPPGPAMRRVWREVAPGEWRWIHIRVDDQDTTA